MLLLAVPLIDREDEVQDTETFEEKDLGEMEQHKSVILHLLSQLKLGMDLTKVCAVLSPACCAECFCWSFFIAIVSVVKSYPETHRRLK